MKDEPTKDPIGAELLTHPALLLRALIDEIPDQIFVKDRQSRFVMLNRPALEGLGLQSYEDAIGETDFDFFPPELARRYFDMEQELLRTGIPIVDKQVHVTRRGDLWVDSTKTALFDAHGKVIGLLGINRLITEQKLAEEALAEERNQLRTLIEHIPDHIYIKDTASRFLLANKTVLKAMGLADQEAILGKTDYDFFAPEDADRFFAEEQEVIRTGQPILNNEVSARYPDKVHWGLTSKVPLRDRQGQIVGLVGVNRDISERKMDEAALIEASRMEVTSTLAGGIAHNFNNLMVGVLGNAELLKTQLAGQTQACAMLNEIVSAAKQAAELAQQMLAFARGGKYLPRPINLNDILNEALQLQKRSFSPRITIHSEVAPDLWPIHADPAQMSQMIMNLCINAVESIEGDGWIHITTQNLVAETTFGGLKPGRTVHLAIEDSGCGMAEETLARIFEPFYTTKFQGRGLGLSAVYGIINNHGGRITASSEQGRGSLFRIYLPAGVPDAEPAGTTGNVPPGGVASNPCRVILIIDDEQVVLGVSRRILEHFGYQVLEAHNGMEAVEIAHDHPGQIHLALLDIGMPIMGGVEAYGRLKQIRPELKVIVCSGYERNGEVQDLLDRGASAFIQKPFRANDLNQAIREALGA